MEAGGETGFFFFEFLLVLLSVLVDRYLGCLEGCNTVYCVFSASLPEPCPVLRCARLITASRVTNQSVCHVAGVTAQAET